LRDFAGGLRPPAKSPYFFSPPQRRLRRWGGAGGGAKAAAHKSLSIAIELPDARLNYDRG